MATDVALLYSLCYSVKPRDTEAETLLKRGMKPELVNKVEKLTGAHRVCLNSFILATRVIDILL